MVHTSPHTPPPQVATGSFRPGRQAGAVRARVAIWRGGSRAELRHGEGVCSHGGERGRITGFSAASRRRLLASVGSVDHRQLPAGWLVTLTYPGEWAEDPARWKRDLDAWLKRLVRQHPGCFAWWKLEPQKRGAPHFHLLLYGVGSLDREWVSRTWYEVVGSGDERHLRAGTNCQVMASQRASMAYASKYVAKVVDAPSWSWPGRWWGLVGRERVPKVLEVYDLPDDAWCAIRRLLTRWERRRSRHRVCRHADGPALGAWPTRVGVRVLFPAEELVRLLEWHGARLVRRAERGVALDRHGWYGSAHVRPRQRDEEQSSSRAGAREAEPGSGSGRKRCFA